MHLSCASLFNFPYCDSDQLLKHIFPVAENTSSVGQGVCSCLKTSFQGPDWKILKRRLHGLWVVKSDDKMDGRNGWVRWQKLQEDHLFPITKKYFISVLCRWNETTEMIKHLYYKYQVPIYFIATWNREVRGCLDTFFRGASSRLPIQTSPSFSAAPRLKLLLHPRVDSIAPTNLSLGRLCHLLLSNINWLSFEG